MTSSWLPTLTTLTGIPLSSASGPGLASQVLAAAQPGGEIPFATLAMELLGGLALFLFGMERLSDALKTVAGERLKTLLARLTHHPLLGAMTGAFVTAVIQSSSVTTVLVVGFISAGLLSFSQSIGIIMGANIGTTITAQIIAFKVTKLALLMIAAGFAMTFLGRKKPWRHHGKGLMGLGLVFFGMSVMGEAMAPLRSYPPFIDSMVQMANPAVGILVGALFTALVQSSSATTGIIIVLASQGLLGLPAGIALMFGANIGTCITALLAAIGRPREALRASTVHVIFNVLGVLLWLPFIEPLASLVRQLSPQAPELAELARLAAETPRQIANAHTLFNVANTLIFIGFSSRLARLVERLVPDRPPAEEAAARSRYLDTALLDTPALALDRVRLEILHIGEHVLDMVRAILPAVLHGNRDQLHEVAAMDDRVDALHGHVITYLGKISEAELSESQTAEFLQLMETANSLENIGDIIETNLFNLGLERIDLSVSISDATKELLTGFHQAVIRALEASLLATTQKNERAAKVVRDMKSEINRLAEEAALHQARRLVVSEPNRLPAYTVETDLLMNLKRIYYFTKRMARAAVPGVKNGKGSATVESS